mmetsp:Transcript_21615/g.35126  ORF Transcript_21615/g.35126 Transcript_21615/m.35126 type:complete len:216 (+) Transcript_21615:244-891(+)
MGDLVREDIEGDGSFRTTLFVGLDASGPSSPSISILTMSEVLFLDALFFLAGVEGALLVVLVPVVLIATFLATGFFALGFPFCLISSNSSPNLLLSSFSTSASEVLFFLAGLVTALGAGFSAFGFSFGLRSSPPLNLLLLSLSASSSMDEFFALIVVFLVVVVETLFLLAAVVLTEVLEAGLFFTFLFPFVSSALFSSSSLPLRSTISTSLPSST